MDVQSGASRGVGAKGLSGAPSGAGVVAAVSGCDGGPVPAPFAPASVKEYEVSGVSGPIVQLSIGIRAVVVAEVEAIGLQSTFAREKAEKAEVESEEVATARESQRLNSGKTLYEQLQEKDAREKEAYDAPPRSPAIFSKSGKCRWAVWL